MIEEGYAIHSIESFGKHHLISGVLQPTAVSIEMLHAQKEKIPITWEHDLNNPIGVVLSTWEDPDTHRLHMIGRISNNSVLGRSILQKNPSGVLFLGYTIENGIITKATDVALIKE